MAELALPHHINPSSKSFVSVSKKKKKGRTLSSAFQPYVCVCAVVASVHEQAFWEGFILTVTRWSHCCNSCVILQGAQFLKHFL